MKIYTITELEAEGIEGTKIKTEFKINCFDKTFIRATDVPKRFKSKAIDTCAEYQKEGFDCFVVETPLFFSVWKEEKLTASKMPAYSVPANNHRPGFVSSQQTETTETLEEENRTPEITKKYRGREVNQPTIVIPVASKPGRKYRGIDYS